MSEQDGAQATALKRPADENKWAWEAYWKSLGQPWRTEPEISRERQEYLTKRREINPDFEQGDYPFRDVRLRRADIEWLLATHENGRGPVDWNDEIQRERVGLDLRGADLSGIDLGGLPLARIIAGVEYPHLKKLAQVEAAIIHLEEASLNQAHLEGASLNQAHLEGANLIAAHLEGADLRNAHVEGANLRNAHVEGASLRYAHVEGANLIAAHLENAKFSFAHLEGANLHKTRLKGAFLNNAHLEGADLSQAHLEGVDLSAAFFDSATNLEQISLSTNGYYTASLCDIHWGDVNVAVVDWSKISMLGDENEPQRYSSIDRYERAARAYRQLSVVLRTQGLNEHAARFAYRAQLMQRKVFWHQHKFLQYLGSRFLALVSGYGYKVGRCFIAYALVIGIFATIYHLLGTHPAWNESIVISMTAFHGRGFFPEQFHPGDPQALAAAIEAFVGLLIEITLIATLTQRFFGK